MRSEKLEIEKKQTERASLEKRRSELEENLVKLKVKVKEIDDEVAALKVRKLQHY